MIIKAEHDQNCDKENLSDYTQCHHHHYCFYKTSCNAFDGSFSELAKVGGGELMVSGMSRKMNSEMNRGV